MPLPDSHRKALGKGPVTDILSCEAIMNRLEIHQYICRSIERQLSMKWPQDPALAEDDSYSLDIAALFQDLEGLFQVRLDLKRDLRGIATIGDLSRFIYEKTQPA